MKKGYLKSLSAAVLASVLVLSSTLCVAAEEPGDVNDPAAVVSSTDVSGNDVSGGDVATPTPEVTATPAPTATPEATATPTPEVTPVPAVTPTPAAEKTKLAAPDGIYWGYNYTLVFNSVPEAKGYYDVQLMVGDKVIESATWHRNSSEEVLSIDFNSFIYENGDYKVMIRSSNRYDSDTYVESDWVESPVKTYVRPEAKLGNVTGYWDDTTPGLLHYTSVEGAGGYEIEIYFTREETSTFDKAIGGMRRLFGRNHVEEAGQEGTADMSSFIDQWGAGLYRVTIRALSSDVTAVANGTINGFSEYYDTTKTASQVKDTLKDALSSGAAASDALATVKDSVSKSALKTAMQTDPETLEQVKELEERYTKEKNISVQAPEVSAAAASYVDSDKIAMVGAGLNAEAGNVQLSVGIPEKPEYVNGKYYKNTVQLAIELKNDNASIHELAVPISITMPIPAGLDTNKLAILHYHEDGSVESVTLKNNGDGTVTFTVTNFSTFVFAEKAETTDDSNDSDDTTDDSNGSDSSDSTSGSDSTGSSGSSSASYDWNDITINVDWAAVSSKLDTAVQAADGTNVNVLTGKDVKVSADILKKIAGKNVTLALQAGNGVALSVSGQNNKQIQGELNLTVTNKDTVPAQVKNTVLAGALSSRNILITENSPLQTRISLHVGLAKEYAGKYANLYYYDAKSGQMKLTGIYQINKDGQSMFALTHGGQYVVTVTDTAAKGAVTEGYTVVSGDTMSRIAVKMGTTLRALKAANPQIVDMNKIRPGQVIKIQ